MFDDNFSTYLITLKFIGQYWSLSILDDIRKRFILSFTRLITLSLSSKYRRSWWSIINTQVRIYSVASGALPRINLNLTFKQSYDLDKFWLAKRFRLLLCRSLLSWFARFIKDTTKVEHELITQGQILIEADGDLKSQWVVKLHEILSCGILNVIWIPNWTFLIHHQTFQAGVVHNKTVAISRRIPGADFPTEYPLRIWRF